MISDANIIGFVQIFLLAMLVVGAAAKEVSKGLENDPNASVVGAALFFAITLIGWIILTVISITALGLIGFGILWAWASFAQR